MYYSNSSDFKAESSINSPIIKPEVGNCTGTQRHWGSGETQSIPGSTQTIDSNLGWIYLSSKSKVLSLRPRSMFACMYERFRSVPTSALQITTTVRGWIGYVRYRTVSECTPKISDYSLCWHPNNRKCGRRLSRKIAADFLCVGAKMMMARNCSTGGRRVPTLFRPQNDSADHNSHKVFDLCYTMTTMLVAPFSDQKVH